MSTYSIKEPRNQDEAEEVLDQFMNNALDSSLKSYFLKASEILYGPCYTIQEDNGHRMYFFCLTCRKGMNSVQSLSDHSKSGTHIKNEDTHRQKKSSSKSSTYHHNSLQYKISKSSFPIVGCQMVEEYNDLKRGNMYYKCILCGAHGKMEAMYKHLIGDKHTDRYIRARIVLKSPVITAQERSKLRQILSDKEPYSAKDLSRINGRTFYPFKWLEDGRSSKVKIERREIKDRDYSRSSTPTQDEPENVVKSEKDGSTGDSSSTQTYTEVVKVDKMFQTFSYGFLNSVFLKLNFIVQTHLMKGNELISASDLKVGLNLLNYSLHLLHHVNRLQLSDPQKCSVRKLNGQKKLISNCLGYVYERLLPYYKHKHGDWRYKSSIWKA